MSHKGMSHKGHVTVACMSHKGHVTVATCGTENQNSDVMSLPTGFSAQQKHAENLLRKKITHDTSSIV